MAFEAELVELGHLLANVVADVEFALRCHHLVVLEVLQWFLADRVIADDLTALGLVLLDLGEADHGRAVCTLNSERVNDLLDDSGCTAYLDIKVAHGAVLIHDQPILNAQFAVELVAVVALLGVTAHLYNHGEKEEEV